MGIAWTVSEIIEHLLFSRVRSVRPWMKVKVNIINTWCIHVTEAVTVSNVIAIASLVSEIWRVTDTGQTDIRTHRHRHLVSSMLTLSFKVWKKEKKKKRKKRSANTERTTPNTNVISHPRPLIGNTTTHNSREQKTGGRTMQHIAVQCLVSSIRVALFFFLVRSLSLQFSAVHFEFEMVLSKR